MATCTGRRVDEEDGHRRTRVRAARGWDDALALLRGRPAPPRRRREDAARLRRRPRPARRLGDPRQGLAPEAVDREGPAPLRRPPRRRPRARPPTTRRPQARRACARSSACCASTAAIAAEPGRPAPGPEEARRSCRARSSRREVAALLDRIPAATPLEVRDRALFELAYACGLRAEELVNLDVASVDFDGEEVRVEGKGAKTRFVPVGETALKAVARYLERARPALARGDGEPALFLSKSGRRLSTSRRPAAPASVGASGC